MHSLAPTYTLELSKNVFSSEKSSQAILFLSLSSNTFFFLPESQTILCIYLPVYRLPQLDFDPVYLIIILYASPNS